MAARLTVASSIQSTKAPWVFLLVLRAGQRAENLIPLPEGFSLKMLKGSRCRTAADLFEEFARVLNFPEYFGHNWDAFEECLSDLEWLPAKGYVLLVTDAEQVLPRNEEDYATFLEVLNDAGEAWASGQAGMGTKRATPFHVLMTVSDHKRIQRAHWAVPEVSREPSPKTTPRRTAQGHRRGSSRN